MFLIFKIFILKRGARETVLSIALIVAILTSLTAFTNYITAQARLIGEVAREPKSVAILIEGSSEEVSTIVHEIENRVHVVYQWIFPTTLNMGWRDITAPIIATDISKFSSSKRAHVEGKIANEVGEANIGKLLAEMFSMRIGDKVTVQTNEGKIELKVVGILSTKTQADACVLVPWRVAEGFVLDGRRMYVIEGHLGRDVNFEEALERLGNVAPSTIARIAQVGKFIEDVNSQVISFLLAWSLIICTIATVVSGVGVTRFVKECEYELEILKSIGMSKRKLIFTLISSVFIVTLIASVLGISLGLVGSQVVSTALRWIGIVRLAPFLELDQLLWLSSLALGSSVFGGFLSCMIVMRKWEY